MPIKVTEYTPKICDVCRLVDGDEAPKPCAYCGLCDSWICQDDIYRVDRRGVAWFKRKLELNYKGEI